ncbi:MAG: glycosyltransferase [Candidatus Hinthialibacter antarcticus]|nr:glycosyltransferase [Candidatus Hinthialibacter antarcticus]
MVLALLGALDRERFQPHLVAMKGPGDLITEAQALGVHAVNLQFDALGKLHGWREWRRMLGEAQPKMIHSFLFHSNLLARVTKLFNPKIKVISGIRTVYTVEEYGRRYGVLERVTHGLDSLYIANSEQGRLSAINNIGLPSGKVRMVPNGIDIDPFSEPSDVIRESVRNEFGFGEDDIVLGVVAQLRPAKRHDLLLEAFSLARSAAPRLRLLVVGGGECEQALREQTADLQLEDVVSFAGYRSDARRILRGLDAFTLPSDVEGIPVSVMEAMEAGLPVIATRVGGLPDLIEDGASGILIAPGDSNALSKQIVRIASDVQLRNQMGKSARERVIHEFSVQRMAQRFEALYEEALSLR